MKEAWLQNKVITHLKQNQYIVIKQEAPPLGIPDLLICWGDRHIWVELKVGKNGLTKHQKACHLMLKKLGQAVFVCRSLEEVCLTLQIYRSNSDR